MEVERTVSGAHARRGVVILGGSPTGATIGRAFTPEGDIPLLPGLRPAPTRHLRRLARRGLLRLAPQPVVHAVQGLGAEPEWLEFCHS